MSRRRSAVLAVGAFTLTRLCFVAPPPAVHQPYLGRAVGACGSRSGGWVKLDPVQRMPQKRYHVSGRPGCARARWRCRRVAAASTTSAPWPAEGIAGTSLLMHKVCARDVGWGPWDGWLCCSKLFCLGACMVQPVPCLRGDADIDAFYNSLLTGSGGDPPKARSIEKSLACRGYGKE